MTRFVAKAIPPLGYRTFVPSQERPRTAGLAADEETGVIESPFFRATLDPKRGRIASLIDKRSGRELVDAAAPQGFGQYFYERFGYKDIADWLAKSLYPQYVVHRYLFAAYDMPRDSVYNLALPENMNLAVKQTGIDVTAVMVGVIPSPGQPQRVSIRLTLPAAMPVADLEIGWQKQPDGWPEAGWICLPFKCANAKFRLVLGRIRGPGEGRHRGQRQLPPVMGEHRRGGVRRRDGGRRRGLPAGFAAGELGRTGRIQVRQTL